jgi:hypothetical protein
VSYQVVRLVVVAAVPGGTARSRSSTHASEDGRYYTARFETSAARRRCRGLLRLPVPVTDRRSIEGIGRS